jgi:hypothetical protein
MPKFNIKTGDGITLDSNKRLAVRVQSGVQNITVGPNGVYVSNGQGSNDSIVDNWTIVSNDPTQTSNLLIRGNDRVIQTCYYYSFLRGEREWIPGTTVENSIRAIETKSPDVAVDTDLKNVDDLIREINFPCWYPAVTTVDGRTVKSCSPILIRPGTLIVLGDDIFPSTIGTSRIAETGFRFSTHTMYDDQGQTKIGEQKAWALFVVTSVTTGKCSTYENIIDWNVFRNAHNYSEYPIITAMTMRCLWSVNPNSTNYGYTFTNAMKSVWYAKGDVLTGAFDPTNLYGQYTI